MNNFILTPIPSNQHKETYSGRVKRDHDDFEKIPYTFSLKSTTLFVILLFITNPDVVRTKTEGSVSG